MATSKPRKAGAPVPRLTKGKDSEAAKTGPQNRPRADGALVVARAQAVRLLSVSDRTFARLESEGVIRALTHGTGRVTSTYDAFTLVPAFLAHRQKQITGSLHTPRDRRDLAQAELAEFQRAKAMREVIPKAEWIALGQNLTAALNAKVRALPNRLARAGVIPSAQEAETLAAVEEMLREIAAWRTASDLAAAAGEIIEPAPEPHVDDAD